MPRPSQPAVWLVALALALVPATGLALGDSGRAADLAKALQNPVADLISVPLQHNCDFGIGPDDGFRHTLNVQPVVPISLTRDWNLISLTIFPIVYQDDTLPGGGDQFGSGDTTQSFFLSLKEPFHGLVRGLGPVLYLPTASDDRLGSEKWGLRPTGVALLQHGPWTLGILANHIWSVAGDDDRTDLNQTFLQPFLSYTFPDALSLMLNTESTYDWQARQWTVPVLAGVSKVVKFGSQSVSFGVFGRYWAEGPASAPQWGIRFVATFLFPKGKKP
jgi:hypothetical protein